MSQFAQMRDYVGRYGAFCATAEDLSRFVDKKHTSHEIDGAKLEQSAFVKSIKDMRSWQDEMVLVLGEYSSAPNLVSAQEKSTDFWTKWTAKCRENAEKVLKSAEKAISAFDDKASDHEQNIRYFKGQIENLKELEKKLAFSQQARLV